MFVLLSIFYFWKSRQKKRLAHFITVLAVGLLLIYFLKYSIARPRPHELYPDIKTGIIKTDPSFPSSHVLVSFLCIYFLPKRPKFARFLTIFYLTILIPFGSLYIGVHYPSDIIVAAIIGILLPILISEKIVFGTIKKISPFLAM